MGIEENEVRRILLEAVNVERWAPKTDNTYPFLEDSEKAEIVERILSNLKTKGYFINKIDAQ
jgi:hypothetical protein